MKKALLTTSLAVFFSLSLQAASAQSFNSAQFIGIDRDASNAISKSEAANFRQRYFTTLDINGDGQVTFDEYVEVNRLKGASTDPDYKVPVPEDFSQTDTNKDKILNADEFAAEGVRRFELLDKDKDGSVSRAEFVAPGL